MSLLERINNYSLLRLCIVIVVGIIASFVASQFGFGRISLLIGWDVTALCFVIWTLIIILPMKEEATARYAQREDPGRVGADATLTLASFASLASIGSALVQAHSTESSDTFLLTTISVVSVFLSWLVIHTLYCLHYAHIYFSKENNSSIDFGPDKHPTYIDFMYVAFTVGMTFQISDTTVSGREMRKSVTRHALLSYVFGAVIIATTVSIVASL